MHQILRSGYDFQEVRLDFVQDIAELLKPLDNLSRLQICTSGPQLVRLKLPLKQSQNMAHIRELNLSHTLFLIIFRALDMILSMDNV